MNQLTIRGLDEPLERRLREIARVRDLSLNRAALLLMRRGAGLSPIPQERPQIGDELDAFIGVWSEAEERDFLESVESLGTVDDDLWS